MPKDEHCARGAEPLRVAIVGGGIAGATIADTLSEEHATWAITLVEKRPICRAR